VRIGGGGGAVHESVGSRECVNSLKKSGAALAFGPFAFEVPSLRQIVGVD
jgi:hypothetical protein